MIAIKEIIGSTATRLRLAEWPKWQKSSGNFSLSWVLWVLWVGTCEESEPVVSLWCDSWEGTVTKLASGLLFFLPFPLPCGGHYITLHYSTLHWGGLSLLLSTLLYPWAGFLLYFFSLQYLGHWSFSLSSYYLLMVAGGVILFLSPFL